MAQPPEHLGLPSLWPAMIDSPSKFACILGPRIDTPVLRQQNVTFVINRKITGIVGLGAGGGGEAELPATS